MRHCTLPTTKWDKTTNCDTFCDKNISSSRRYRKSKNCVSPHNLNHFRLRFLLIVVRGEDVVLCSSPFFTHVQHLLCSKTNGTMGAHRNRRQRQGTLHQRDTRPGAWRCRRRGSIYTDHKADEAIEPCSDLVFFHRTQANCSS